MTTVSRSGGTLQNTGSDLKQRPTVDPEMLKSLMATMYAYVKTEPAPEPASEPVTIKSADSGDNEVPQRDMDIQSLMGQGKTYEQAVLIVDNAYLALETIFSGTGYRELTTYDELVQSSGDGTIYNPDINGDGDVNDIDVGIINYMAQGESFIDASALVKSEFEMFVIPLNPAWGEDQIQEIINISIAIGSAEVLAAIIPIATAGQLEQIAQATLNDTATFGPLVLPLLNADELYDTTQFSLLATDHSRELVLGAEARLAFKELKTKFLDYLAEQDINPSTVGYDELVNLAEGFATWLESVAPGLAPLAIEAMPAIAAGLVAVAAIALAGVGIGVLISTIHNHTTFSLTPSQQDQLESIQTELTALQQEIDNWTPSGDQTQDRAFWAGISRRMASLQTSFRQLSEQIPSDARDIRNQFSTVGDKILSIFDTTIPQHGTIGGVFEITVEHWIQAFDLERQISTTLESSAGTIVESVSVTPGGFDPTTGEFTWEIEIETTNGAENVEAISAAVLVAFNDWLQSVGLSPDIHVPLISLAEPNNTDEQYQIDQHPPDDSTGGESYHASLSELEVKVSEIKKLESALASEAIPQNYENIDEAEQALQILRAEVASILNNINTTLENTDPDEFLLDPEDKYLIEDAADLIGGHSVTENPLLELYSETQQALVEAGYSEGEDFEIVGESKPNCHTYTLSASGLPTPELVVDIGPALSQYFNPVALLDTSNMSGEEIDSRVGQLGLQDGDVFVFMDDNGVVHSGIVRISEDGEIRFESAFGFDREVVSSAPSVTFDFYDDGTEKISEIKFYRKKHADS